MNLTEEQKAAMRHGEADDCSLIMLPMPPFWNDKDKTDAQKQEIVDRAQTLQRGLELSYEKKVRLAKKVIKQALDKGIKWAVSYSGGKDSTVLSHLMVETMGIKHIPHVMSNTRMEYPETGKNVSAWYARLRAAGVECHTVFPDVRPKELWSKIGLPLWSKQISYKYRKYFHSDDDRISKAVPLNLIEKFKKLKAAGYMVTDKCCNELKKKPMKKWDKQHGIKGHFTGVRCAESRDRRLAWILQGALYHATMHNTWICNPLAFWTEADVERYMQENQIGYLRPPTIRGGSGCVTCMFGCHLAAQRGELNALQQLSILNPKMHKTALDDWGYREVLDFLEIPYEIKDKDCF